MKSAWIPLLVCIAIAAAACTENPTQPRTGAGRYRLVSVNGQPLPFEIVNSLGFARYDSGDLYLRPDATYGFGIQSTPIHSYDEGTWRLAGESLELTSAFARPNHTLTLRGDSIVMELAAAFLKLTFKRSSVEGEVLNGAFSR